jgi:DNA repair photolyase
MEYPKSVITYNESPDLPFTASINPYRGCEHGCVYCYARPAHAYMDLSPGLDFESRLFAKAGAVDLLRRELAARHYRCQPIAFGTNTDAYQPIEREYRITRSLLELLCEHLHPFTIVTKSALVERDLDLIAPMGRSGMAAVYVSVTTLDRELARSMEPRAAAPARRLRTIERLSRAGVPTGLMFAPVIPALNDHELEAVLEAGAGAGALRAGFVLLRLPLEVQPIFSDWLTFRHPLKADRVLNRVRDMRDGKLNDARFGSRQRGTGEFARLLARRFEKACARYGINRLDAMTLDTSQFRPPRACSAQQDLFDPP